MKNSTVYLFDMCARAYQLPLFPYNRGKVINPIVGVYIPITRIPIKGGMTIPNIATFDQGTVLFLYSHLKILHAFYSICVCDPVVLIPKLVKIIVVNYEHPTSNTKGRKIGFVHAKPPFNCHGTSDSTG